MQRPFFEKLREIVSHRAERRERVSIVVPFLIICIALGGLAFRSYYLSVNMERGASTLAQQYAAYASEVTARRVDAAAREEIASVSDDWRQIDRNGAPTFAMLREHVKKKDWLIAAIYVPDADPEQSIYVSKDNGEHARSELAGEFYTSTGTVRYTYDAERLLRAVEARVRQSGSVALPQALSLKQPAYVSLVRDVAGERLATTDKGFTFTAPLAPPLSAFGVRTLVRTDYVRGTGWQNQRVVSLWLTLIALILTLLGAVLTVRGMRKEAETMRLRAALIANVSHELRTPLSMIRLGAETLTRGKLSASERSEIEGQIMREVLLLSHLVENVLDVARIHNRNVRALAFTPVSPADLIRNLVRTYDSWIHSKGFDLVLELDESVGDQMWDRDAVSRALLNLIDNAIKYSGDEKVITVALSQTESNVVIEVKDRGLGIESAEVARIFDPYYRARFSDTTTRRGAGLGLTLVQQIVRSHGGEIAVESVPGEGSTFRLLFPRALGGESAVAAPLATTREAF